MDESNSSNHFINSIDHNSFSSLEKKLKCFNDFLQQCILFFKFYKEIKF